MSNAARLDRSPPAFQAEPLGNLLILPNTELGDFYFSDIHFPQSSKIDQDAHSFRTSQQICDHPLVSNNDHLLTEFQYDTIHL